MLDQQSLQHVLENVRAQHPETQEFVSYWLKVLEEASEDDLRQGALTFNRKIGQAKKAEWAKRVENEDGFAFLIRSGYNHVRDLVRSALEVAFPEDAENGIFDHIEVFVDEGMFPRNSGESSKNAKKRHLAEEPHEFWPLFGQLAALTPQRFVVTVQELDQATLLTMERLFASLKDEDLNVAKQSGAMWLKNHGAQINARQQKIRWLRLARHQHDVFSKISEEA